jgi:hypothetical protein
MTSRGTVVALLLWPGLALADWSAPVNLGSSVNSSADEFGLTLSADELTLIFDSDRAGGAGGKDLYQSTFSGSWGAATPLTGTINTPLREYCPALSPDGTQLLFTTEGFNLRISTVTAGNWNAGTPLNLPVNSQAQEWGGRFFDASTIFFSAWNRAGGSGGHDVWRTAKVISTWQAPTPLNLNTAGNEYTPFVTAPGDTMYLAVNGEICHSRFNGSTWSTPTPVPGLVNHPAYFDTNPVRSPDGQRLYFTSERPGGSGGYDIWFSTWQPGTVAVPPAVDGPSFLLADAMPNPFRPRTSIAFTLVHPEATVRLSVYDVSGRLVRTLFEGSAGAGQVSVEWDGRDVLGKALPSGTYLYRLETSSESQTKKLSLLR